jgi:hypothetical protein
MRTRFPIGLIAMLLPAFVLVSTARAQVPGFAEIRRPAEGDRLPGLVTILGTADHPAFTAYELEFAFDPNPTGTWFPITERVHTSVQDARLAVWDTSEIAAGTYQLRLRVFTEAGEPLTAIVGGLAIGEAAEPAQVASEAVEAPASDGAVDAGADQAAPADAAQTSVPLGADQLVGRILAFGALAGALLLGLFAIYAVLRPRLREHAGHLRMRRVHRRIQRRRKPGR